MKKYLVVPLVLAVFTIGCVNADILSIRDIEPSPAVFEKTNVVTLSNGKFKPDKISIKSSQEIQITNLDARLYTLFSDPHPTHDQIKNIYILIYKDQTRSFSIPKKGTFGLHAEENPSIHLKILVK